MEKANGEWEQVSVPESHLERMAIQGGSLYRTWLDGQHGPSVAMVFVPDARGAPEARATPIDG